LNRRTFLVTAAAGVAHVSECRAAPESIRKLRPMTAGIQPITSAERQSRLEKARRLMRQNGLAAVICEGGSSMYYFTGVRLKPSDRLATVILPARGEPVWVVPEGDHSALSGDVRRWNPSQDPLRMMAQALTDRGAAVGRIGIEERTRFFVVDGLGKALPRASFVSAVAVTAGCRMIKSRAEIALLQRANEITIAAYRAVFAEMREGMTQMDFAVNVSAAYQALGVEGDALVIFGKYTAYPHGSSEPQKLREGDVVLVDDGCSVEGYQSDVTRTTVFGKPTPRQRQIWELERKAQNAAFAAAKPGATCESVDAAARKVITDFGFGPDYRLPGLSHRTGHGIGLDGHEWTYLVRGNQTRLEPGMCFSDEPTIAIEGEFGIRLEDCLYITEDGARMFTHQSPAIDQPFG
jgi:Xaa-Pro dipeptidase